MKAFGFLAAFLAGLIIVTTTVWPALATPKRWINEGWTRTDFSKSAIDFSEILSGGPPKDGIPSIDDPKFVAVGDARDLVPTEPVIGLEVAGDARAYPLRIMIWHEIVNDTVGGRPVAVTYCPLCNTAIVFSRTVSGQKLSFGTTGKLRFSDLVMYDRTTESWWQQFTGEAIIGDYVGQQLKVLPARLESFADFKSRNPSGRVLVPNDPTFRAYGKNPYFRYDSAARPFLFSGKLPEGIAPMARVVAVRTVNGPIAIALRALREAKSATIEGITLSWKPGQRSALDTREIVNGRDVGTVSASKTRPDGTSEPIAYDVTFAFAFHAFHPRAPIHSTIALRH